jgi:hypothetical protein
MAMGTDKEDTDPSSPSALRISGFGLTSAKPDAAPVDFTSSSSKPTTDPGLGPRPASDPPPPLSGARPHAVVVPPPSDRRPNSTAITPPEFVPLGRSFGPLGSHKASPSSPSLSKDSVELLLEGMAGPRPDRRKTTPQSDGEASAAYHAEHGLRPARPSSEPGPKVVVERPVPGAPPSRPRPGTTSPGRAGRAGAALPGSREALSTFVPGRVLRRRVAMAILAGVLIVLLSFMGLRLSEERRTAAAPAVPRVAAPVMPEVEPTAPAAAAEPGESAQPSSTTVSAASGPTAATASPAAEPSPPGRASGGGTTRHRHHVAGEHVAGETTPPQDDLGEFKSKF